ncbi:hypothetical protein [Aquihabitans sp. McL0605]|uniref:hypothetical protein n=1 Tax=Aquihabitans sp. McL0605 TaxID=3415671 RepID=UPI003CF2B01B
MPPTAPEPAPTDPVLVRRAQIARAVTIGQRVGYALFGVATVAFFFGLVTGYTPGLVRVVIGSLLIGSAVLAPAIVFGYAVKAAEREDQGLPSGH